ncbi:alpha/beta fold hydrolase [Kitasatospora sp. P5_F3]
MSRPVWSPVAESHLHGEPVGLHSTGTGPAMLLLHGLEDSWTKWTPFAAEFEGRFRCYAADLPWRTGGTYGWRTRPGLGGWAEGAADLVPEPVSVLVAHSMGANAVLQWLAGGTAPKVDALVLLAPLFRPPSLPVGWRMFEQSLADFRAVMTAGLRANLGTRADTLEPEIFDVMATKMIDKIGPLGFLCLFEHYLNTAALNLSHVTIPTLIIGSTDDPGIAGERGLALRDRLPGAELHMDPNLSHFCHVQQTREIAELILGFLERHPTTSRSSRTEQ